MLLHCYLIIHKISSSKQFGYSCTAVIAILITKQDLLPLGIEICMIMSVYLIILGAPFVEHSNTTDHFICANLNSTDFSCVSGTVQAVDLYCKSVGGFPIPTVTWYHNGNKMINANVSNGTLMLNNTACDLLGTYQCVVSNEVGSKTTLFRILPYGKLRDINLVYVASCSGLLWQISNNSS